MKENTRHILLLPFVVLFAIFAYIMGTGEWIVDRYRYFKRPIYGDKRKRKDCCANLPESYGEDVGIDDIPSLKDKIELTFGFPSYKGIYCCKICGQEWELKPRNRIPNTYYHNEYRYTWCVTKR